MGCGNSNDAKDEKKKEGSFPNQFIVQFDQQKVNNMMQWYIVDGNASSPATTTAVNRAVAFFTRQSMERDGFKPDDFSVKVFLTSDPGDVCNIQINSSQSIESYGKVMQQFWDISYLAYQAYDTLNTEAKAQGLDTSAITFSPELGLPMTTMTSIPLLFFPPNSTKFYSDYQYAQTVTAWWANMAHNGATNADMIRMTRIVDITALVATATAAKDKAFKFFVGKPEWDQYVEKQLDLYVGMNVKEGQKQSIPIVVMGSEPKQWLYSHYKTQIDEQLNPDGKNPDYNGPVNNDVVVLKGVVSSMPDLMTPVMFSVHPSAILFSTNQPFKDCLTSSGGYPSPFTTCMQGQIAAGWNVIMAKNPQGDALAAKTEAEKLWNVSEEEQKNGILDPSQCSENKKRVLAALIEKYYEFGYDMKNLDVTEAERSNYVTDTPDVDNWVRDLVPVETSQSPYQLFDPRFVANKILIAGGEQPAFSQFVTPTSSAEAEKVVADDRDEHSIAYYGIEHLDEAVAPDTALLSATASAPVKMQIKIVSPRPWQNASVVQQITDQWNKDQLALHYWDNQDIQGSVLTNGWVLPPSSHNPPKKEDETA